MINEAIVGSRMEELAIPYQHESDEDYEHLLDVIEELEALGEVVALNKFTGREKLWYALLMADSILLLHSFPGGVIVHDGKFSGQPQVTDSNDTTPHIHTLT